MEENTLSFWRKFKNGFKNNAIKPTTYGLYLDTLILDQKMVMDKMVDLTKSELEWGLSLAFFSAL
jgi:hypothetical protein